MVENQVDYIRLSVEMFNLYRGKKNTQKHFWYSKITKKHLNASLEVYVYRENGENGENGENRIEII